MVNDDKPFLQLTDSGVILHGSPWSGKHGLDSNLAVSLKGLCILERGKENAIWPISPEEVLPMLQKQAYQPMDTEKEPQFINMVKTLSVSVPLWKMACNQDPEAAQIAFSAMHQK